MILSQNSRERESVVSSTTGCSFILEGRQRMSSDASLTIGNMATTSGLTADGAGETLKYAEYGEKSTRRSDAEIDRRLVGFWSHCRGVKHDVSRLTFPVSSPHRLLALRHDVTTNVKVTLCTRRASASKVTLAKCAA